MESKEDAEMLFGPAPGPSHLRCAIPYHNDNEAIIISDSELEGHMDLEDIGKASKSISLFIFPLITDLSLISNRQSSRTRTLGREVLAV
jgi:hypothetical protein